MTVGGKPGGSCGGPHDRVGHDDAGVTAAQGFRAAGAHVTVQTPAGLPRKYSLCNDSDERDRYVQEIMQREIVAVSSAASLDEVSAVHGLGPAKYVQLQAVVEMTRGSPSLFMNGVNGS